jgi:hypothetical protein
MFGRKGEVVVQIAAQLAWQVIHDPQSGQYIGVCPALNLNAAGDSWVEFQECANEAMQLLFADLFEDDELEAFLRRNGWQMLGDVPPGRRPVFDIPANITQVSEMQELTRALA